MVSISAAEKTGLTDGAITFLGSLGVVSAAGTITATAVLPTAGLLFAALVAGAIAGLNSYRNATNATAAAPAK